MTRNVSPAARDPGKLLENGISEHGVPGAALGILHDGEVQAFAAGVLSVDTGTPVEPDSIFRAGSITKPFTATLLMQLADDRLLDLDRPVQHYLPGFRVQDRAASSEITTRHLLSHTCGVDGDFFIDTGDSADPFSRYLESARTLQQLHPPGEGFSYCNFGYVVAGALFEALSQQRWCDALRARLAQRLSMDVCFTGETMRRDPIAAGHTKQGLVFGALESGGADDALPASAAPAGTTLAMTAPALLRFARLHLDQGRSPEGEQILSRQSAREMLTPQARLPQFAAANAAAWGLGWCLYDWAGSPVFGHDGDIDGQFSFLRADPDSGTALVLLTNGGAAQDLAFDLFSSLFDVLAGIRPREIHPRANDRTSSPEAYVGRYERLCRGLTVESSGEQLYVSVDENEPGSAPQAERIPLQWIGEHTFQYRVTPGLASARLHFGDFDSSDIANNVLSGYRLAVRKTQPPESPGP